MEILMFINCFILAVVVSIFLFVKYRYSYWTRQGIPSVAATFPYGSYKIIGKTLNITKALEDAYNYLRIRGLFGGIYMYFNPVAIPTNIDLVKDILRRDFNTFSERGLYYFESMEPLGCNLYTMEAEKWKEIREQLEPTLSPENLKYMFPKIMKTTNEFENVFRKQSRVQLKVEIYDLLSRYVLDVIGSTIFGSNSCNSLNDHNSQFAKEVEKLLTEERYGGFIRAFRDKFPELANILHLYQLPEGTHYYFYQQFRSTLTYREQNNVRGNDYIDILMKKIETYELPPAHCAAHCFTFLTIGYETTSIALSFALYEMAKNQNIQDKAREEINEILAKYGGELTYDAIDDMKYIDKIIKETLRLHPPMPYLTRKTLKDYHIEKNPRKIQKGIKVIIPICGIQKDERYHQDPEEFNPERFSAQNLKKPHPCSYMPFGDGPRNCIGMPFAKMLIAIGFVTLLKNFKFLLCDETEIPVALESKSWFKSPQNGIVLKVESL